MRLTVYSDYALRVLIYLGQHPDGRCTIADIAAAYGISRNHLMKVVHHLARHGDVASVRGRGGGIRLARPPQAINVGTIVRATERDGRSPDCLARRGGGCRIEAACALKDTFALAAEAFFTALDRITLADLLRTERRLERRAGAATAAPPAVPVHAAGPPAAAGSLPRSRRRPARSAHRGTAPGTPRRSRRN